VGITTGPDGNLWFTETVGNIGRITPTGTISEFPVPFLSLPIGITTGPDGNLWFIEALTTTGSSNIGRITPAGTITAFPLPGGREISGITAGPDGNLWFTELSVFNSGDKIGRISPTGTITEFPALAPGNLPFGITAGPDGNLWFTEFNGNKIGRLPPVFLTISPGSGVYMTTQHFDLTLRVYPAGLGLVAGRALFDGEDVTEALGLCGVVGTRAAGGATLRCPNLSGSLFAPGVHTFSVSITLSDGSVASDTATWQIEENHEP
jgi:DNA-binding beta-propeller fold protein YncE